jgi:hypothetical protein
MWRRTLNEIAHFDFPIRSQIGGGFQDLEWNINVNMSGPTVPKSWVLYFYQPHSFQADQESVRAKIKKWGWDIQ